MLRSRPNIVRLVMLFSLLAPLGKAGCAVAADEPLNVIFFLSDDHRWDRLGCAGHPILKTPTIDKLAADGSRFSNMFVTTSICAASRATLLTGLYERSHRYTFGTPPISPSHTQGAYPAVLKNHGYRTGFVGKFGVNTALPPSQMFDYMKVLGRSPYWKKQPDGTRRHVTEIAGDMAIDFLNSQPKDQPFCLSVSFNAAHAEDRDKQPGVGHYPWPKAVDGLYEDIEMPAARLSAPEIFERHPEFMKKSMNRDRYFWRWDNPDKFATNLRAYYRMITGLDRVMGRVLERLDALGLADNTVVIFSGDNGYYEGQRGFAGKWSHYDESLRVPLIIKHPQASAEQRGVVVDAMALNVDIASTIVSLANAPRPEHYQGSDLSPWVLGQKPAKWRTDTFCEHLMDNAKIPKWEGVRGSRYVYARYFEQQPVFEYLHDLTADPDQLTNLADSPQHANALQQMRQRANELRDQYGGAYDVNEFRKRRDAWRNRNKPAPKKRKNKAK